MENVHQINSSPEARSDMTVHWGNYRFTVLTSRLIRMEFSTKKLFEDHATQTVLNRYFDSVNYDLKNTEDYLEIITTHIHLIFHKEEGGFTKHNLKIEPIGNFSSYHSVWYFGEEINSLKGTARTLDLADGEVDLEEGLMNKDGFSIINDSSSMVIKDDGWVEERQEGIQDYYYFGYGRDYLGTLKDYYRLTGKPPILPRYALGNWWSRYHAYSDTEYKKLMERFEKEKIPFSVAVIDMDWHITEVPSEYGSGWTGYTWNKKLFPDPAGFIKWLHDRGLKVSLNLHPANGVQPHEEMYEEMAAALGVNIDKKEPINFDIANPEFKDAYFKYLHHPHENIGIDFWWVDWQSGSISKVEGLDPLWMLNHYHFLDIARNGRRPLIFSRYAGFGSHRYPIGFSGDSVISWKSLQFQPYFTATASNAGYTWWSHDIGGHMYGTKDDELYIRWIQFGVFSPINRLHSTSGLFYSKEPWRYSKQAEEITGYFLRLRHQFIPYLYTMNHLTHEEGLPLIQPMYYKHPWENNAYEVPNQYYFGTQLIVAPITSKVKNITNRAAVTAWFPEGKWFDFFTGRSYIGNRKIKLYRRLSEIPVFAKAGGIVPLSLDNFVHAENPGELDVYIYPGADGNFTLYEDNETINHQAFTKMNWKWHPENVNAIFTIHPVEGGRSVAPSARTYNLHFMGMSITEIASIMVDDEKIDTADTHSKQNQVVMKLSNILVSSRIIVHLDGVSIKEENFEQSVFEFLDEIQIEFEVKNKIMEIITRNKKNSRAISELQAMDLPEPVLGALSEIIWAN